MIAVSACIIGILGLLLAVVRTWRPPVAQLSAFEQKRRADAGDAAAMQERLHHRFEAEIVGGMWLVQVAAVIVLVATAVGLLGVPVGVLVSICAALLGHMAARLPPVAQLGKYTSTRFVAITVRAAGRYKWLRVLLWAPARTPAVDMTVHSAEEFEHLVQHLGKQVVSPQQKDLLLASLTFDARTVGELMTPRQKLATIAPDEFLGPLIVSELHQTGQQWFLVTVPDTHEVVGVIALAQLTDVRSGTTPRARDIMHRDIERIPETQAMRPALEHCLVHDASMALVTDASQAVVGMVTVRAMISTLLDT